MLTATEIREVRRIAGKLGYLATCVSLFAALAASHLQQVIPSMTVARLKVWNGIIPDVMRRVCIIIYHKLTRTERRNARIVSLSDQLTRSAAKKDVFMQ